MVCSAGARLTSSSFAHASVHLCSEISFLKRRASTQLWVSDSYALVFIAKGILGTYSSEGSLCKGSVWNNCTGSQKGGVR
jgi:hypothetical protein